MKNLIKNVYILSYSNKKKNELLCLLIETEYWIEKNCN